MLVPMMVECLSREEVDHRVNVSRLMERGLNKWRPFFVAYLLT